MFPLKNEKKLSLNHLQYNLISGALNDSFICLVANEPPIANTGGNQEIQLPKLLVTLDGSKSTDDHKITDYLWERDPKSLAAGVRYCKSPNTVELQWLKH